MTKPPIWRDFPTQAALRNAVRAIVDAQAFNTPFADTLISDLIAERHYFCSLSSLRPAQFKKTHENDPYRFYGLFAHGWHPVSWTACVSPPPTRRDFIVRALRTRTEPVKTAFRRLHLVCMQCGKAPSAETHHADPTFNQIIVQTFAAIAERDVEQALGTWDWFKKTEFALPEGHPILCAFDPLHASARLEALCKLCHNTTKIHEG